MNDPASHQDETEAPGSAVTSPADESTVGTGTGIALGCIALTVFLTLIGVVILLALR